MVHNKTESHYYFSEDDCRDRHCRLPGCSTGSEGAPPPAAGRAGHLRPGPDRDARRRRRWLPDHGRPVGSAVGLPADPPAACPHPDPVPGAGDDRPARRRDGRGPRGADPQAVRQAVGAGLGGSDDGLSGRHARRRVRRRRRGGRAVRPVRMADRPGCDGAPRAAVLPRLPAH
jgi:hypothetical protein